MARAGAVDEPAARRVQIGHVLRDLKSEFPDISISKIRYLEGEGLITPQRSESGYRYFSETDIERLRFILTAQRDRFWPLKVIRNALDAMDRGLTAPDAEHARVAAPPIPEVPSVPAAEELRPIEGLRLTEAELCEASGADQRAVNELTTYGLIKVDAEGYFGPGAVQIAREAARLGEYGIEPRHLRPFRLAADRELALVEQAAANVGRGDARVLAREELLRHCLALHLALLRAAPGRN